MRRCTALKSNITITEDTFTPYLEWLHEEITDKTDDLLKQMARELVGDYGNPNDGFIAPNMSTTFNPNLFISGQEEQYWLLDLGEVSSLEVIYTGMRLPRGSMVWWEFGDKEEGIIERDYAFYQETGLDKYAEQEDARHTDAVYRGVMESREYLNEFLAEQIYSLMRKGGGGRQGNLNSYMR